MLELAFVRFTVSLHWLRDGRETLDALISHMSEQSAIGLAMTHVERVIIHEHPTLPGHLLIRAIGRVETE